MKRDYLLPGRVHSAWRAPPEHRQHQGAFIGGKSHHLRRLAPSLPFISAILITLRLLAVVLLAAFTMLVSVDKICCPDGCTDRRDKPVPSESAPHHATHTCVLCVGVDGPPVSMPTKPFTAMSTVTAAPTPALPSGTPGRVDHPPRAV
jgi:hypothetical protein